MVVPDSFILVVLNSGRVLRVQLLPNSQFSAHVRCKLIRVSKLQSKIARPPNWDVQYCAKVMQVVFDEIPGFSRLFEVISIETKFR